MACVLIVKTGDAYPEVVDQYGDFETLFEKQLSTALPAHLHLQVWDAQRNPTAPALDGLAGILITGSHSMVSDAEPWSEALKPWLKAALANNTPMLGVCYGHQLMADAFGGVSDYHPAGRESGTHTVRLTQAGQQDPLFSQLPERFAAHLTHAQSVMQAPQGSTVLAHNSHDAHQALRYGPRQWSVQFHPEFTAHVMSAYLKRQQAALLDQGEEPDTLLANVIDCSEASSLLRRFLAFV
ncbi:glutamine amidotransferase [Vreelandella sulfidaeris]|uniref:Glutamine amidotransferase n=1 Tax=Vreelandella sulfidaeris TaxID=115553 RepID=A0A365TS92_9GAMM|nr:glutamine amidotransferase [Halomonas sulfidaeris]RBI68877.1 glutamine amidotransferase [Halomonas sulfidaeris]